MTSPPDLTIITISTNELFRLRERAFGADRHDGGMAP